MLLDRLPIQWADDAALLQQIMHRHTNQHRRKIYWSHVQMVNKRIKAINELQWNEWIKQHGLAKKGTLVGQLPQDVIRETLEKMHMLHEKLVEVLPRFVEVYKALHSHLLANGVFVGLAMVLQSVFARLWVIARDWIIKLESAFLELRRAYSGSVDYFLESGKEQTETEMEMENVEKMHLDKQLVQNNLSLSFFSSDSASLPSRQASGSTQHSKKDKKAEKKSSDKSDTANAKKRKSDTASLNDVQQKKQKKNLDEIDLIFK